MARKYLVKVLVRTTGAVVITAGLLFTCQIPRIARLNSDRWEPEYASLQFSSPEDPVNQAGFSTVFAVPPFAATGIPAAMVPAEQQSVDIFGNGDNRIKLEPGTDAGLTLYRSFFLRDRVIEFYTELTGSLKIATAILENADRYNVPVSFAFSLAWAESEFHPKAVHKNIDSIDRGLFQLNSKSFPRLSLEEFFDPETSARYGLAYLSYCLTAGGNDVVALAMYNAGPNRVEDRGTPRKTLDYIHKIIVFRENLEATFLKKFASEITVLDNTGRARTGRVSLDIIDRVK